MVSISATELKRRMTNNEDLVILDVRLSDERNNFHIEGDSLNIPLEELQQRISEIEPFRDREIIIYCRSGNRSGQACMLLGREGFKTANLMGGLLKWIV
ncbi:MAG: rhodanese-like domain-containing protein [Bacteroidetes bacterium]|nr:rhodanese-like domain-containing protein [Bacteroidota bacterium]